MLVRGILHQTIMSGFALHILISLSSILRTSNSALNGGVKTFLDPPDECATFTRFLLRRTAMKKRNSWAE